jgi:hypothetical protein
MINIYAYTYQSAMKIFAKDRFILVKIGDSTRDVDVRMSEQGGAAEYEAKIKVGSWENLKKIKRDHTIHKILTKRGLHHTDGKGTEWFKIPAATIDDAQAYVDQIIASKEGHKVRPAVILRNQQKRTLERAMEIIKECAESGQDSTSIIANLCPRFGKTIWALMLFKRISEEYGNRVMLLPAYWLSAHSSFEKELDEFADFINMRVIDTDSEEPWTTVGEFYRDGKLIVIPISLHGEIESWKEKHRWISTIPNELIFNFADEGDFGTHTENQVTKMEFLFS